VAGAGTKAEEIAVVLEAAIVSGELRPGAVLRQEQLSEEFGVSRTPVREALQQLAALGLVSFAGSRGVKVRPLARDELFETFIVRAALEGYAAELARTRLTKQQLRALRQAERDFERLTTVLRAARDDERKVRSILDDWRSANWRFHDVYLSGCGVAKLAETADKVRRVFPGGAMLWPATPELDELYSLSLDQHREIMVAFEQRSTRVRKLVERHILDSARILERALDRVGYGRYSELASRLSWSPARRGAVSDTPA
jgi:DNA-binding GntR family transcriptional regulator